MHAHARTRPSNTIFQTKAHEEEVKNMQQWAAELQLQEESLRQREEDVNLPTRTFTLATAH